MLLGQDEEFKEVRRKSEEKQAQIARLSPRAAVLFGLRAAFRSFPFLAPQDRSIYNFRELAQAMGDLEGSSWYVYLYVCGDVVATEPWVADTYTGYSDASDAISVAEGIDTADARRVADAISSAVNAIDHAASAACDAADPERAAPYTATFSAHLAASCAVSAASWAAGNSEEDHVAGGDTARSAQQVDFEKLLGEPVDKVYRDPLRLAPDVYTERALETFASFCTEFGLDQTARRIGDLFTGEWPDQAELIPLVAEWAAKHEIALRWAEAGKSLWPEDNP